MAPSMTALPPATIWSLLVGDNSTAYVEPGSKVTSPATCKVPMELPGATVPPRLAVNLPIRPLPPRIALSLTVTVEASEPLIANRP
ncbi:hypothetical protein D3C87_2002600 [compost metagenome]